MVGPTTGLGHKQAQKPMSPELIKKLISYWNGNGGINGEACPTCMNIKKRIKGSSRTTC